MCQVVVVQCFGHQEDFPREEEVEQLALLILSGLGYYDMYITKADTRNERLFTSSRPENSTFRNAL